jgi:hypothetical protein
MRQRSMFQAINELCHKDVTRLEIFAELLSIRVRSFLLEVRQVPLEDQQKLSFFLLSQMKSVHNDVSFQFIMSAKFVNTQK